MCSGEQRAAVDSGAGRNAVGGSRMGEEVAREREEEGENGNREPKG